MKKKNNMNKTNKQKIEKSMGYNQVVQKFLVITTGKTSVTVMTVHIL